MLTTLKKREITPSDYRYTPQAEDPKSQFEKEFAQFLGDCAEFESASKAHVYESQEEVPQVSFRVHCGWLAQLISSAQNLIFVNASLLAENPDLEYQFKLLQQKTDEFIVRLYDWHGPPGTHPGEPPRFKQAISEVELRKVEEFEIL